MRRNRSVPPSCMAPILAYPDVRAAVEWLSAAFGFVERTRSAESHRAQPSIGTDSAMTVAEHRDGQDSGSGSTTYVIRVRVLDVDASFEQACGHLAQVSEPPVDR